MYIEKRMSEIANDYDDGEGYLRDKSDRRVIDEYFVGLADVQEMYRPLSEDTDLEDIVNSSTLHENSLFMSPEHTQFCYKATHKGIIFLLEKDEN